MPEWTVTIDSPSGTVEDDSPLDLFLGSLEANERAGGPASSVNTETGVISATFTVTADNRDDAALTGSFAYWDALAAASVRPGDLSTVHVSPVGDDDDVDAFRTSVAIERAAVA